jgi:outer membrane protein insertion porin family
VQFKIKFTKYIGLLSVLLLANFVNAQDFLVEDIKVQGLKNLSYGQVLEMIPVRIGQNITSTHTRDIIKKMYFSGMFEDVSVSRESNVLIVSIIERPTISKLDIIGNKLLKKENLLSGLESVGVSEGGILNEKILNRLSVELEDQYKFLGRYDSKVDVNISPEDDSKQRKVTILIKEGPKAKIQTISFEGNTTFNASQLKSVMSLKEKKWSGVMSKKDHFMRPKLKADIDSIRTYYRDNGFLKVKVTEKEVNVSDDFERVDVAILINEGARYTIRNLNFVGYVLDDQELQGKNDDIFNLEETVYSQTKITNIELLLEKILGLQGFLNADIRTRLEFDDLNKTVDLNIVIEPGKKVYVRRINFTGNNDTQDEVLRREMRQMESAPVNTHLIEKSKIRLQRLSFLKDINTSFNRVEGYDDLIDLNVDVTEEFSGSIGASLGYADSSGLQSSLNFEQNNFLGTGQSILTSLNYNEEQTSFRFGLTNPYYTLDGVSRGINLFHQKSKVKTISQYKTDKYGVDMSFGYPLSENQRIGFSIGYSNIDLTLGTSPVDEISNDQNDGFVDLYGDNYNLYIFNANWRQSTLNRSRFATSGASQSASIEWSLPGGDLEYYKFIYRGQKLFPLYDGVSLRMRTKLGYGQGYGDSQELPFFEHFFTGGFGSVRGFLQNSLGPKDTPKEQLDDDGQLIPSTQSFGGDIAVEFGADLIFPMPFLKNKRGIQSSVFIDAGNVFSTHCRDSQELCGEFKFEELRASVGIGVDWHTVIGPLRFSFSKPIQYDESTDKTKNFQFSIGSSF